MRLYRGLAEPYRPESVGAHRKKAGDNPNAALGYVQGRRGVLLAPRAARTAARA